MPRKQRPITAQHVRAAAKRWDKEPGLRGFRKGTRYEVLIGGKSYPPKAIASIANELAGNGGLFPKDFPGAWEGTWHNRLAKAGYRPQPKADRQASASARKSAPGRDSIFDILNASRFAKCQRAFLVTGRPGREQINEGHIRNNRSGDWSFDVEKRGAAHGDAFFILMPSPNGGYPRRLFGGLIKSLARNKDHSVRFHVDKFTELPEIESDLSGFLGGQTPARGNNVLTVLDGSIRLPKATGRLPDIDDDLVFPEGEERRSFKEHVRRERHPRVVGLAKSARMAKAGCLECEVCGFDFTKTYGDGAKHYIEGHHTKPVHQMKKGHATKISDIALVCSNCHRMNRFGGGR